MIRSVRLLREQRVFFIGIELGQSSASAFRRAFFPTRLSFFAVGSTTSREGNVFRQAVHERLPFAWPMTLFSSRNFFVFLVSGLSVAVVYAFFSFTPSPPNCPGTSYLSFFLIICFGFFFLLTFLSNFFGRWCSKTCDYPASPRRSPILRPIPTTNLRSGSRTTKFFPAPWRFTLIGKAPY